MVVSESLNTIAECSIVDCLHGVENLDVIQLWAIFEAITTQFFQRVGKRYGSQVCAILESTSLYYLYGAWYGDGGKGITAPKGTISYTLYGVRNGDVRQSFAISEATPRQFLDGVGNID